MEITDIGDRVFLLGCTDARGRAGGVSLKQPIAYVDPDRARAAAGLPAGAR